MPLEPSPWDRKDFVRERTYEDFATASGKWKDPHQKSGDTVSLRVTRSDDGLRDPVLGKQGNSRLFLEESVFLGGSRPATDPRSHDRMIEDVNCRHSSSHRSESKASRTGRDLKSSGTASCKGGQREWKCYQSDGGDAFFGSPTGWRIDSGRYMSHLHHSPSASESSFDRHRFEKQNDKMGVDGFQGRYSERAMDVRIDRPSGIQGGYSQENALGSIRWKPLKWARPSSISSLGSGISQSGATKSGKSEIGDAPEVAGKATSLRSPPGETVTVGTSVASEDSSHFMKKQRLGWGQGLAKYEKEKVDGQEDTCGKSYPSLQDADPKRIDPLSLGSPDNIQALLTKAKCESLTVTSLPVCDSSSGIHANYVGDLYSAGSMDHGSDFAAEDFISNLDSLDINAVDSLIADLMHCEDSFADHSGSPGSASLYKLASLKNCIMKLLERKEGEIDQSENELRSLFSETECIITCQAATNAGDGVMKVTREGTNELEESLPGLTPLNVSLQSGPSVLDPSRKSSHGVPSDVQFQQTDNSVDLCQACDACPAEASNMDSDLVKFAYNEEVCSEPVLIDKGSGTLTADQKRTFFVEDVSSKNDFVSSNLMLYVDMDNTLIASVLAPNKELAREAATEVFKFLPVHANVLQENPTGTLNIVLHAASISADVEANLVRRKHLLRFKERALILKFRAFRHLWKEDLRLLSVRKHRTKQPKRLEPNSRTIHTGFQKHRSSISSRFTSPEVVAFTRKLLSDSQAKVCRDNLKMPAMILDENERNSLRFISWNGLVEDPCYVEKERTTINPWTAEEKEIFIEYFAAYGKDFSKIASHLKHKTTADCVEFYYKNHKSDAFDRTKKSREKSKQSKATPTNAYLVTNGKKWNMEEPASSLDILGAASVAAGHAHENQHGRLKYMEAFSVGWSYDCKTSEMEDCISERMGDIGIVGNERDARASAVDLTAGICGALSSEAVSSCVTSSIDPGDGSNEWKYLKMDSAFETPFTPDAMQNIDEDTCSDESSGEVASSDWTDAEKAIFITALRSYGKDFATISRCVGSRSTDQCKIFFSKARKCLALDIIHMGLGSEGTPLSDAHGGGGDTEDACAGETDSQFCIIRNSSKMERVGSPVGFGCSVVSSSDEGYGYPGSNSSQVKESVLADCEEMLVRSTEEILVRNEDHPADSLVQASLRDHCGAVMMGTEKVEEIKAEVKHDNGGLAVDVANENHEVSGPDMGLEGPKTHLLASQVGDKYETHEVVNNVSSDIAAEPTQDSVVSDACSPGLLDSSNDKSKSQLVTRNCSSNQIIKGIYSDQHDSSASVIGPSSKGGGDHGVSLSQRVDLDQQTNGLFNCLLDVNESSKPQGEGSSATGTCSVSSYNSQVSERPLTSPKVLACSEQRPVSWQRENCQLNSSQGIGRGNLIDASTISHRNATSYQVAQLPGSSSVDVMHKRVPEAESMIRSNTKIDFYQESGAVGQSSHKVDPPAQNFKGFSLQAVGSASSVCEKRQLHHSMAGVRKLHDLMNSLTMQDKFLSQESGNGLHNTHLEYSLFLPKKLDALGGAGEPISASLYEASCGSKQQIAKKLPENATEAPKPGEVKLFGQSLVVHPPVSKADNNSHAVQKQHTLQERNGCATEGINLTERKVFAAEVPRSTYGYWDGTRIQTGLSALPDSGLLISNGSRVSDNRTTSCNRIDQRTLSADKFDDRIFYGSREVVGTSGIANYHIYSSEPLQPFTLEVNSPLSVVSELHKRSMVIEKTQQPLLGLQNQARGVSGMSSVSCVSDPVVALKMQFGENFCKQNGVREEDSWRGDINR